MAQSSAYSYTERKRIRKSFGNRDSVVEIPSLLQMQKDAYTAFLQAGIPPKQRTVEGLQARVLEQIYHGDHVRLRVACGGSDQVMVKLRYGEGEVPAPGAEVTLAVAPEHCLALDAPQ